MLKRHAARIAAWLTALTLTAAATTDAAQQVEADRFVVVSGHPEATQAGLAVLEQGGNAIDAAVTVAMCLGVAEPYGSGLGGKLVVLYHDAETGRVHCIESMDQAPGALEPQEFADLPRDQRRTGYRSAAIPGMPAGWAEAHRRWGTLSWRELVMPAAELADRGVTMTEQMRHLVVPKVPYLLEDDEAARFYLVDGDAPPVGHTMRNPDLARSLRLIAEQGVKAFYDGPISERIVTAARAHGSPMSRQDLRNYRARVTEPVRIEHRGYELYTSPAPTTGGVTLALTLACLEPHDWQGVDPRSAEAIDAVSRVLYVAYPKIQAVVADVSSAHVAIKALLSRASIERIRAAAMAFDPHAGDLEAVPAGSADGVTDDASTTHFVVIDADGHAVSATQSLSYHFGAAVVPPGTGVLLNNTLNNFATQSVDSVNYVGPGKRPRSTIAPTIVIRDGRACLAIGVPGGQRIPTMMIQTVSGVLDFGLSPAESIDLSRYHLRRPISSRQPDDLIDLERGLPESLADELELLGWQTNWQPRDGRYFGGVTAAGIRPDGTRFGVADDRRTNVAAGR